MVSRMPSQDLPATTPPSPRLGPIRVTQTITQTEEAIPSDHYGLTGNDEDWVYCLIPTANFDLSPWLMRHHSIHVIRQRPGDKVVDVAVIEPHVERLRNHVELRSGMIERCLYEPSEREECVHGTHEARKRARRCFIESAVGGILSRGPGLGRFYQQRVDDVDLLAVIEWTILERDIEASPPDICDDFLLSCLFVTLVLLRDLCGDFVTNVLKKRDRDEWMKVLREICVLHRARPFEDPEQSMHKAAILRVLLERSSGIQDASHFDRRRSVNDNLKILCGLFVGFDEPVSFRGFDDWVVRDFLLRGPLECAYEDVVEVQRKIQHGPFGFWKELYEILPAATANSLPYDVVCEIEEVVYGIEIHRMYDQVPWLKADPENGLQVLLCYCINRNDHLPAICGWATSDDGRSWYHRTAMRLHRCGTAEQVALSVTALLSYKWFAGSGDKAPAVTSNSYLVDFVGKPMTRKKLKDRRGVWTCMASSIQEFLGEGYMPRSFTDGTFTEEPRPHWPHGLVDMYKICAGGDDWVSEEKGQEHPCWEGKVIAAL